MKFRFTLRDWLLMVLLITFSVAVYMNYARFREKQDWQQLRASTFRGK